MDKVYKSKVDWWIAALLPLPLVGSGAAVIAGLVEGDGVTIAIGVGSLALFVGIVVGLIVPLRYAVCADGLRVRAGLQRLHVTWDRLIKVEPSSNPTSSLALSLKRLNVEYRKPNGRETFVLISPMDRDAFLRDLAEASPRHVLDGGVLVQA
jgi:hypothetical protein